MQMEVNCFYKFRTLRKRIEQALQQARAHLSQRELRAIADTRSETVTKVHNELVRDGLVQRSDYGSEFVARQVKKWLLEHGIGTHHINPGSPWQKSIYRELRQHLQNDFPEPLVFSDIGGDESPHPAVAGGVQ